MLQIEYQISNICQNSGQRDEYVYKKYSHYFPDIFTHITYDCWLKLNSTTFKNIYDLFPHISGTNSTGSHKNKLLPPPLSCS